MANAPAPAGLRLCAFCQKPLPAHAHALRKTHEGECTKAYAARAARIKYAALHPKATTATPPAVDKDARLQMIREAAAKVG